MCHWLASFDRGPNLLVFFFVSYVFFESQPRSSLIKTIFEGFVGRGSVAKECLGQLWSDVKTAILASIARRPSRLKNLLHRETKKTRPILCMPRLALGSLISYSPSNASISRWDISGPVGKANPIGFSKAKRRIAEITKSYWGAPGWMAELAIFLLRGGLFGLLRIFAA